MIILFDENKTLKHSYVYRADFRQFSGNILEAIERCESDFMILGRLATMADPRSKCCYVKLVRWPAIAFIQKNTNYAMMATLLMGKKMEFSKFVQSSGHDEAFCLDFINKAHRLGYVEISRASLQSDKIMQQDSEQAQVKLGLFSRIRVRLGLGKTKRHP